MTKLNIKQLENIHGKGIGAACYFSSMMAVGGLMTMNFALVHIGATTFYGCVRYL